MDLCMVSLTPTSRSFSLSKLDSPDNFSVSVLGLTIDYGKFFDIQEI